MPLLWTEIFQPHYVGAFIAAVVLPGSSIIAAREIDLHRRLLMMTAMTAIVLAMTALLLFLMWQFI